MLGHGRREESSLSVEKLSRKRALIFEMQVANKRAHLKDVDATVDEVRVVEAKDQSEATVSSQKDEGKSEGVGQEVTKGSRPKLR